MLRITETGNTLKIEVKVQPRASRNQVVGEHDGALKIKLAAPPVEGEANRALLDFLADVLKLPKKNITLLKGDSSRHKLLEIYGMDKNTFLNIISNLIS
ncbi:DUF167 domain-containing protein [Syntrophomonas palmitatica]|uniref:DUF167 domain-containing protein n=1 Tax=Syntrophomonas palmitatica TaxID=402877 RepID=UPI0006D232E8|nr:DUF167 domain-containing protein [Syntrophomonas palmitatica]